MASIVEAYTSILGHTFCLTNFMAILRLANYLTRSQAIASIADLTASQYLVCRTRQSNSN